MLPTRGSSDFTEAGNNDYPMLGVVAVYPYMNDAEEITAPRTGYVHVTGVPDNKYQRIKDVLERQYEVNIGAEGPVFFKKRVWAGVASRIPVNARNRLLADRKITVTWTQFRNFIQNIQEQRDFSDADMA
jgi:hypothetical protein